MKNTRAGTRNSHSVTPLRSARTGPPATRAPSSTSLSTIDCAIHRIQPTQLRPVRRRLRRGGSSPPRRERSALLDFGLHRVLDLLHRDLRVGLLALEIGLPDRLADDELLQPEEVVVD